MRFCELVETPTTKPNEEAGNSRGLRLPTRKEVADAPLHQVRARSEAEPAAHR